MGFIRHLSADEILMQLQLAMQITRLEGLPVVRNVVMMGMGEPLNLPSATLKQVLTTMTDPKAFALSPNFVTVGFDVCGWDVCVCVWYLHLSM
jgi:adenine C2-methylase RlmN of 23S rRNA A2503 and tRNA A37